ncbi:MAG: metallophosphoesterase family protein [Candidatus Aphodosoma sp.]
MKKKILLFLTTVVLMTIIVICVLRWNVWFHNAPEPFYTVSSKIAHIQLSLGDDFNDRFVSWQSIVIDSAEVNLDEYGVIWMPIYDSVDVNYNAIAAVASVIDSEFESDTSALDNSIFVKANYRYIQSAGGEACYFYTKARLSLGRWKYSIVAGDTMSCWYEIEMPDVDTVSILVIADVQDKQYSGTDTLLNSIINRYKIDAVLQLGDLVERPHQQYWNRYFQDFRVFTPTIPMLSIPGNHDYIKGVNKHIDERFFCFFPSYLIDDSIPEYACMQLKIGNTSFFVMDTNEPLSTLYKQKKWLLDSDDNSDDSLENKIILMHHPMQSAISRFRDIRMKLCLGNVFNDINADLVMAAHEHTVDIKEIDEDLPQIITNFSSKNYDEDNGGRYYTLLLIENGKVRADVYDEKHVLKHAFNL